LTLRPGTKYSEAVTRKNEDDPDSPLPEVDRMTKGSIKLKLTGMDLDGAGGKEKRKMIMKKTDVRNLGRISTKFWPEPNLCSFLLIYPAVETQEEIEPKSLDL
jgi:hypothetical protein